MTSSTQSAFRTSIVVAATVEHAFDTFTSGFDSWWLKDHHIGAADVKETLIEGEVGGRWLERGVDGSECEWGRVLRWDPPHQVTLSWHLTPAWGYDPDPKKASQVDVRFIAEGERSTRVEFVHSELDRHGDGWPGLLSSISDGGGWPMHLEHFAKAAAA